MGAEDDEARSEPPAREDDDDGLRGSLATHVGRICPLGGRACVAAGPEEAGAEEAVVVEAHDSALYLALSTGCLPWSSTCGRWKGGGR